MKIEALHKFHEEQFAQDWSSKFIPTEERVNLFKLIFDNLDLKINEPKEILELGIGPGYLAEFILKRANHVLYEGLDFSIPMLEIASKRLDLFRNRKIYTQADLTDPMWVQKIKSKPEIIVSTWALHDLLKKPHILNVYKLAYETLPNNGKLINGDFIKPEESTFEYEKGRLKPSEHIQLLEEVGFQKVNCIKHFEKDVHNPTTSNNYSCFIAIK